MTRISSREDPFGPFPVRTGALDDRFASLDTFQAIDVEWHRDRGTGFVAKLETRAAAVSRSRTLRVTDAVVVPTSLRLDGRDQNFFALCQNDAELSELFDLATEEPPR